MSNEGDPFSANNVGHGKLMDVDMGRKHTLPIKCPI